MPLPFASPSSWITDGVWWALPLSSDSPLPPAQGIPPLSPASWGKKLQRRLVGSPSQLGLPSPSRPGHTSPLARLMGEEAAEGGGREGGGGFFPLTLAFLDLVSAALGVSGVSGGEGTRFRASLFSVFL